MEPKKDEAKPVEPKPVEVKPKPVTPKPKPASGGCPEEIRRYLAGNLPTPAAGGVRPEVRVSVAAGGGLSYEVIGTKKGYAAEATAGLPALSSRLKREQAAALPCSLRL